MPSKLVKCSLDFLYPPMIQPWLNGLAEAKALGDEYVAYLGYRTRDEQMKLYLKGRTQPGPKVTNARGGYSVHNYGGAIDHYLLSNNQPNWTGSYVVLQDVMVKRGLQIGVTGLVDPGHVQLPISAHLKRREVDVLGELYQLENKGGIKAVWERLDQWGFDKLLDSKPYSG